MKNVIYYFSGTGNSLAVARDIAKDIGDARIEAIGTAPAAADEDCETVGFVFPVYYYSLPTVVKHFAEAINLKDVKYIYVVATYGAGAGTPYKQLQACIGKNGNTLSAAYGVWMPGNYIFKYGAFPKALRNFLLKRATKKAAEIAECVKKRKASDIPQGGAFAQRTEKSNLKTVEGFGRTGERFVVADACTGCGVCEKVCPAHNIKLSPNSNKPVWGTQCEQCMSCIQWCPARAIDYGDITVKRKRYHHPAVKAADLFRS